MYGIIVCGTRDINAVKAKRIIHKKLKTLTEEIDKDHLFVVNGGSGNVDHAAKDVAKALGIRCVTVYANWDKYKRAAGPIRNGKMARMKNIEKCIAVWDGDSTGTLDMITKARAKNIKTEVVTIGSNS